MTSAEQKLNNVNMTASMADLVDVSINHHVAFEMGIENLEELLMKASGSVVDLGMTALVQALIMAGDIDEFRFKLLGKDGNGGWWGSAKIAERRQLEPGKYCDILVSAMDGMGDLAWREGKMPLGFYDELCVIVRDTLDNPEIQAEQRASLLDAVIRMTKVGVLRSNDKLTKRLHGKGIFISELEGGKDVEGLVMKIFTLYS